MQVIINRVVFIVMIIAVICAALSALISLMDFDGDHKYGIGYICGIISVLFVIVLSEMAKRGMI